MKIRKLQLKNIGVFDDETIEFQPCPTKDKAEIHIFTGQNGSGKTTVLASLISAFDYYEKIFPIQSLKNSLGKRFRNVELDPDFLATNRIFILFDDHTKSEINVIHGNGHESLLPKSDSRFETDKFFLNKLETYRKYVKSTQNATQYVGKGLTFAAFACSGYRQIESEPVQANYFPNNFNPLSQSLNFVKDYRKESEISINQLVANNISNRALSKEDGSLDEAKKYETVINAIETFIKDITDYEVKFVLKRSPNELKLKMHGEELDFDVLPDGLRSLISWIADLLGRVDMLKWQDDLPINEKNLILLLDEIEVHLHPEWQRKVLPVVQKLFKNSQIFVSTHSPFVVNSVDDAWVYKLKLDSQGKAKVESVTRSEDGNSYSYVLEEIFDIKEEFGIGVQKDLEIFKELRNKILASNNGNAKLEKDIKILGRKLAKQSEELNTIIQFEIRQINRRKGTKLTI